jgi:hypothetical protein
MWVGSSGTHGLAALCLKRVEIMNVKTPDPELVSE